MYEMNKEKLSHVFTIYAGGVLDASYSYQLQIILVAGIDNHLFTYYMSDGQFMNTTQLLPSSTISISTIAVHQNGLFLVAMNNHTVYILNQELDTVINTISIGFPIIEITFINNYSSNMVILLIDSYLVSHGR